jgi:hypothetical protein
VKVRKLVIEVVSKFNGKGFKDAEKAVKRVGAAAAKSTKQWASLAQAQNQAAVSADRLAKAETEAGAAASKAGKNAERAGKKTKSSSEAWGKFKENISAIGPLAVGAGVALTAFGAASALVAVGVISTGVSFEALRARLKTVEGSAEGAKKAFAGIQAFAKSTPFQLEEVTTAFVRLKSLGLDASNESLKSFGNLAAAQGIPIIEVIEAVADASTFEFERIKSLGVKASVAGEKVSLTFKGQTKVIAKEAGAVQDYLRNLGDVDFAGAMADQMATTSGSISNLQDKFATFLDTVAQMGVLDEFKALLTDLSGIAGDGEGGFAKSLAESLVRALHAVRDALAKVTEQDIKEAFHAGLEAANAFVAVLGWLSDALRVIVDVSGGADMAIVNLTLSVVALSAAFMGPAGLVVAAGAIGATIGNLLNEFFDASGAVEDLLERITGLKKELASLDAEKHGKRGAPDVVGGTPKQEEVFDIVEAAASAARKRGEALGLSDDAVNFFAQQAREDVRAEIADEGGLTGLAPGQGGSDEGGGLTTFEGLTALSRGEGVGDSPLVRRAANEALREIVGENLLLESSGKVEAQVAKASKKGKKGKKGKQFFDFQKQAESAARTQGEKFAADTLLQLRNEGVAVEDAITQSREAGKKRSADLKQKFLEAGRVFDASANGILDILGLKGPGSVLEGRPPPQTLLITIAPVFKFIETFTQTIGSVQGAKGLEEVSGEAGRAAVEAGFSDFMTQFEVAFGAMTRLQADRLLKAEGGGKLSAGPSG